MSVKWVRRAREDMTALIDWHHIHAPDYLPDVAQKIWDTAQSLSMFPRRGRVGRVCDTRELIVPTLPYILVYTIESSTKVSILRLLHQHQNWLGEC